MAREQEANRSFTDEEVKTVRDAMDMLIRSTQRQINTRDGSIGLVFAQVKADQERIKEKVHSFLKSA